MSKKCFPGILFLILCSMFLYGQKAKKPVVMVFGTSLEAGVAAVQIARSNVPVCWVMDKPFLSDFPEESFPPDTWFKTHLSVLFAKNITERKRADSVIQTVLENRNKANFVTYFMQNVQAVPLLRVVQGTVIQAKESKNKCQIVLSDQQKYTVKAFIDAQQNSNAVKFFSNPLRVKIPRPFHTSQISTLLASGYLDGQLVMSQLSDFTGNDQQTCFKIPDALLSARQLDEKTTFYVANAQALAAVVAYKVFFDAKNEAVSLRKVQGECMSFGLKPLVIADVDSSDPNSMAIQKVVLSRIFGVTSENGQLLFNPSAEIRVADIRPALEQMYTRSQIWFANPHPELLTVRDAVSLLKIISNRGNELDNLIEAGWQKKFNFSSALQLDAKITKYQFAVLLSVFANPFAVQINQQGSVIH